MNAVSSNAVLAHHSFDDEMWADWQCSSGADQSKDLSTTTATGRIADVIALAIDNSGASRLNTVTIKSGVNAGMIDLLRRWIDEYGDDEAPDLDVQLAELRSNRLALRERC